MKTNFVPRNVAGLAQETLSDTPITIISGARQVGKSTLMGQLIEDKHARVVNLDDLGDRNAAQADPDGFAAQFPEGILAVDEIQRVPELLTSLKANVDRDRRPGRFIATGSANLLSLRGAHESLAGRAETIQLEGFSQDELEGRKADFVSFLWELPTRGQPPEQSDIDRRKYLQLAITPSFPEARRRTARSRDRWLRAYTERLLTKDTTDITGILYPDRLETLLNVIAARNSSEFVAARIGRDIDIPARSIPAYLHALQSVFLTRSIPGWSNNIANRAVSTPKVSLSDTGLAAHLAGVELDALEAAISSTITGGLLEGFVAGELAKQSTWSTRSTRMFHYRDDENREVDFIVEDRSRSIAGIEVKASSSPGHADFAGLRYLRDRVGDQFVAGVVLHTGQRAHSFGDRLWALPLSTLWRN
ncbi:ATP-binding protein [Leucobacter albus]|uniref:ATP-binding protein n=1 Tax=Leucobacter albus TaxID=272210 RepID=A0ABW3TLD9_9MICO